MKDYRDLQIYILSFELAIKVNHLSLKLPKHELYEIGSQVRRSSQSIRANIAEGYGRRRYKNEFIRFLIFSHSSCLETISHIEMISNIYPDLKPQALINEFETLGAKLFNFINFVEKNWKT